MTLPEILIFNLTCIWDGMQYGSEIVNCNLYHVLLWQPCKSIGLMHWFWSAISQSSSHILSAMWSFLPVNPMGLDRIPPLIFRRGLRQDQRDGLGATLGTWPRYLSINHIKFSETFTAAFAYFLSAKAMWQNICTNRYCCMQHIVNASMNLSCIGKSNFFHLCNLCMKSHACKGQFMLQLFNTI